MRHPPRVGEHKAVSDLVRRLCQGPRAGVPPGRPQHIIIIKEAAPSYEGTEPVILQGHLDMVCEKEPGCPKDLEREGLDLEADGDFVTARGTTLGGDDGIAVAMALALLDAQDIPHPRWRWSSPWTRRWACWGRPPWTCPTCGGKTLINLDSEEEGVVQPSAAPGATGPSAFSP